MSWKNTQLAQSHKNKMSTSRLCFLFFFFFHFHLLQGHLSYLGLWACYVAQWVTLSHLKLWCFFICCYTTVENLCLVCLGSSAQFQVTHGSKAIIDQLTLSLIYEDRQRIFFVCVFLVPGWFISKWAWMTVCPLLAATCTSPPQSV